jgi:hypothetical protein
MGPRVTNTLKLSADGRRVAAQGPIGGWDGDEVSATFAVVITQTLDDGEIVMAEGRSTATSQPPDRNWQATARVNGNGAALTAGPATAWGIAAVKTAAGGYETYTWPNSITLVKAAVPALVD